MSTPIKPTAHSPSRIPPIERPTVQDVHRPGQAATRRGESDKIRPTAAGQSADQVLPADGLLFAQLLMPPGGALSDNASEGGFGVPLQSEVMMAQLVDELVCQLPLQAEHPFNFTLSMPHLGKVQVKANKNATHWAIELSFDRPDTLTRLQSRQGTCEQALTQALRHPVQLSMHEASEQ